MRISRKLPSLSLLQEYLKYYPDTGHLFWLKETKGSRPDTLAGHLDKSKGYIKIMFQGTKYGASRIAWKLYYEEEPPNILDHINSKRADNRIENLRAATNAENVFAGKLRSDNTTGIKGVQHWTKGRYRAIINMDGKRKHIGIFDTKEEAQAAYQQLAQQVYGDFADEHGAE